MNRKRVFKSFSSFVLFLFIFEVHPPAYAQYPLSVDSLKLELSKAQNVNDSVRALCQIAWNSWMTDRNQTFACGQKALELSNRLVNKERIGEAIDAAALGYWVIGNLEKAKELYREEIDIGNTFDIPRRIAWGNYNLADILYQQGNFQEAREYAVKSRAAFQKLNNIDWVINRDQFLNRTYKGGNNAFVDTAISDIKIAINQTNDPHKLLNYYLKLIYVYGDRENKTQTMVYAVKAMEIAEQINDKKALAEAYRQIGNYLRDYQHNYEIALLYYRKILEIYTADSVNLGVASALNDIGFTQKLLGNDSLAFSSYFQSLTVANKINHRHSQSNAYKNIGELYYQRKMYRDALTFLLKSYEIGCDKCPQIAFHSVLVDAGNVYLNAKDYANAQVYFKKSLLLSDSAHAKYEQAVSYSALSDLLIATNKPGAALKDLYAALGYAMNANSLSLQKEISSKLSQVYRKANNFRKAFEYYALSNKIADSLKAVSEADNISRLETKFEFQNLKAQKDLELSESQIRADAEISKQKQIKYFFIAAFVFVAAFGALVYLGLHRKRKYSKILEEQKRQIEKMMVRVHEADQKKLNFFSNISHELRTPLTLILGPTEKLVKDHSSDHNALQLLRIIKRNTLQLYNLINQLLDIRKLDTGDMKLRVSEGDIAGYSKGICSTFTHLAEINEIKFGFTSEPENIIGWFNKDIVEKSLNNLLSNAFKYTFKDGEINVKISPAPMQEQKITKVKIVIQDNGKGIPDDQIQYVFDRYYQVENTNTGFNTGTGIGLAYTRELVELHKGEISVQSKLGQGTTFTIVIPIHESVYSINEKSQSKEYTQESENSKIRRKYLEQVAANYSEETQAYKEEPKNDNSRVILIVEDNDDLRVFIKSIFVNHYIVYEAGDGLQGYQMAIDHIPDVIISDIMMPGMNGLELCGKLKSNIHTNHIPILILTAKAGEENELEGLRTGADDYLIKPFNSEILEARTDRLIESRKILREYFTREFLLSPKEIPSASLEDKFLQQAVKIVEENISNPGLDVEMLMKELSVSRTQLYRKLKAITNYSANQFIRIVKLKRAAHLLQNTSYNITEVLYQSGFNSPSYFTSCFKEVYGCLPKDYATKNNSYPLTYRKNGTARIA